MVCIINTSLPGKKGFKELISYKCVKFKAKSKKAIRNRHLLL